MPLAPIQSDHLHVTVMKITKEMASVVNPYWSMNVNLGNINAIRLVTTRKRDTLVRAETDINSETSKEAALTSMSVFYHLKKLHIV